MGYGRGFFRGFQVPWPVLLVWWVVTASRSAPHPPGGTPREPQLRGEGEVGCCLGLGGSLSWLATSRCEGRVPPSSLSLARARSFLRARRVGHPQRRVPVGKGACSLLLALVARHLSRPVAARVGTLRARSLARSAAKRAIHEIFLAFKSFDISERKDEQEKNTR